VFDADVLHSNVTRDIVYLETTELTWGVYNVEDYQKHARWQLKLVTDDRRTFTDAGTWLYFKEATVLLRRFEVSGICYEGCIHSIGYMMGAVSFLRDFVIEHDTRRSCIYVCSEDVGAQELTNAVAQLRRDVREPSDYFMRMLTNALVVSGWDNGLFHLFGIMQIKYYQLRKNVAEIMTIKQQKGEMN